MITLLIIADDFTGALDTGVQFAAAGAGVRVVTDIRYDYRKSQPVSGSWSWMRRHGILTAGRHMK